jgi:RHS repeat-associated protein
VLPDHLGSATTLTDTSGQVVARERYSAFGERRRGETPLTTDQLYTGQRYNALSALYHYSDGKSPGRFYDPLLSRFIQADNVTPGQHSQALNRYALNFNNPIKYVDPNGQFPVLIAAGAAVGGAVAYGLQVRDNFQGDPNMGWQAALTTNIDGGKILTGAVIGATAVATAPAAAALVGEGLMGAGLATGSAGIFGAGMSTVKAAGDLAGGIYGVQVVSGTNERQAIAAQRRIAGDYDGKTAATTGSGKITTLSGWDHGQSGYVQATDDVMALGNQMGFSFRSRGYLDKGRPGHWQASHAELQAAVASGESIVGVSRPMCPECQSFYRGMAQYQSRAYYVADPDYVRSFYPSGNMYREPWSDFLP